MHAHVYTLYNLSYFKSVVAISQKDMNGYVTLCLKIGIRQYLKSIFVWNNLELTMLLVCISVILIIVFIVSITCTLVCMSFWYIYCMMSLIQTIGKIVLKWCCESLEPSPLFTRE